MQKISAGLNVIFLTLVASTMFILSTPASSEAKCIGKVISAYPGPVTHGKQLITLKFNVKNSDSLYSFVTIDSMQVEIHGKIYNAREKRYTKEVYSRGVKVNKRLPLDNGGKSANLRIEFKRKVDPKQGMYRYDSVDIEIISMKTHLF